ncbi:hypothetical protein IKZ80_06550 [bacterium]|nr:hypothetical protein [bacterium]
MNDDIRLINLETGGNQAYIFATNKLRNVVGASELLYRVGTNYVARALAKVVEPELDEKNFESVMGFLDNFKSPIEENPNQKFEVIIATSGKALLLARGEEMAKDFIRAWSQIVVTEAPGVDAVAVYSDESVNPDGDLDAFKRTFDKTHQQMSLQRMEEGLPLVRFQRLPIVAECAFSGLPAVDVDKETGELVSAPAQAQRQASRDDNAFLPRMRALFKGWKEIPFGDDDNPQNGLKALEGKPWLAVVHADGNGLGQLFINFKDHVQGLKPEATGRDYIKHYRAFSSALDQISRKAFQGAVDAVWKDRKDQKDKEDDEKKKYNGPDIVPIVVGGDDLTVVMDGYRSLEFTKVFMETFCKKTADHPDTKDILSHVPLPQLGMCAGISIAKPHFPFSQSYDLAEGLMSNAKQVKNQYGTDAIALDFHILYDSVSVSIADIRRRLEIKEGGVTRVLTAKPYVVQKGVKYGPNTNANPTEEWEKVHDYNQFVEAQKAVAKLPSSQAHAVREALFGELVKTQESEWDILLSTYRKEGFEAAWGEVYKEKETLYGEKERGKLYIHVGPDPDPKKKLGKREYTYFLDALEAMKFHADAKGGEKK